MEDGKKSQFRVNIVVLFIDMGCYWSAVAIAHPRISLVL